MVFKSNKALGNSIYDEQGGAICANEVNIVNSTFENNYAEEYAGAVYAKIINVNVNQSKNQSFNTFFINNEAENYGGGAMTGIGTSANIFNAVFIGNKAGRVGGAIEAEYIAVTHCLFKSNVVSRLTQESHGGAICTSNTANIENCTFEDNYAYDHGGAVYARFVNINVGQTPGESFSSFFINNRADDDDGGAIRSYSGKVTAVNALFSGNSAEYRGGAIYSYGDVYTDNCLFKSNKNGGDAEQCSGGAIYVYRANVHINNSTFEDNYAEDYGGAIYADNIYVNDNQDSSQPYNSFFINNKPGDNDGGALYSDYDIHVKNAVFRDNSAYEDGGAIFCCDNAYITHCLFENNKASGASAQSEGGAIHCKDDLTVESSIFNKNYAYDYGGAIYADTLALKPYCSFEGNTAYDNQGGAIWVNKFREDVSYARFSYNKAGEGAKDDGGAIYINNENWVTFSQCIFDFNHCGDEGGAIYLGVFRIINFSVQIKK